MTTPTVLDYRRPWLYPKQLVAVFCAERVGIIEASTKSGKTHACIAWLFEQAAQGGRGRNYWWVAPIYGQAKIAYTRLKQSLPTEVVSLCKWNESDLRVTLWGGQVIWFKGSENPDSLFGEDVWACVVDEATRVREASWHAVRTTLTATRGPIRIIGNVKGRKNWAYRLARLAEGGEPNMHYAKLTAYDAIEAGVLTKEEVMDARRVLPAAVFQELYMAEPSEDQGNPFRLSYIQACTVPLSMKEPNAWGWDLAKSQDWTVGIGLDEQGMVCRFERWQRPWEQTVPLIDSMTGSLPALVDSTGVGDPIVERLQKGGSNFEGYKFTAQSKQQLMEGLALAIQQRHVGFPEGQIVNELEAFEYVYTRTGVLYSAPEGMTDDCVCALALAVSKLKYEPAERRAAQGSASVGRMF